MKKISAVFDKLNFADSMLTNGIKMAESSRSSLSGVSLESFLYKSYLQDDLIGTQGISQVKMKHLLEKDKAIRLNSVNTFFEQACENAKINFAVHRDENLAIKNVCLESMRFLI